MIQRLALRERRGVKNGLNPEHLGEGKGQRSKRHRDEPVENDDWFTQSNHIVLYAANQEYPSPECQRLCVILAGCDRQEHTAEVVPTTFHTVRHPWPTQFSCISLQQTRRLGSK